MAFFLVACGGLCAGAMIQDTGPVPETSGAPAVAESSEKTPAAEAAPPAIAGPRDLLGRHGLDESHFAKLIDGRPVDENEAETLRKVIFWVHDFPIADVERWSRRDFRLAELIQDPEKHRVEFFALTGRVSRVEPLRPEPEVVERLGFEQYYRCEFTLGDRQQPAVIFTRSLPKAWKTGGTVDERASAFGLFLKFAGEDPAHPVPVFVAPRIAWHPETLLGDLGMDVGLLDDVQDKRRLTDRDRECFYQMLDAAGRAKPHQLLRAADKQLRASGEEKFSVVPLFNRPEAQHGRLVALSGTARRVVRLRVEDPDIRARFGIDHYYNVFLFTDDSQNNPIVFCVRRLPEGMPTGDGPQYGEQVRVAGFFMKAWAYPVALPDKKAGTQTGGAPRQVAPLLIGREPVWYPREEPSSNTLAGAIAGGLFVAALLGVWLALWRYGRSDRQFRRQTIAKTLAIDSAESLDEIALGADAPADSGSPHQTAE